jgi:hypothetical protein
LNDERRLAFQPAVHPGDGGNDEDHETRNGDACVQVGSDEGSARAVASAPNVLSIVSLPSQPRNFLGPDDDFILRKLALHPLSQEAPEGRVEAVHHDFDHGNAVFLRPTAALPEVLSRGP